MSKCEVIALANQKGGVGKTTTAVNLGVGLARQGNKVLLIDNDAQANLTISLGYRNPDTIPMTLPSVLQEIIKGNPVDIHSPILNLKENIDLVPSNVELSGVEVDIANMKNGRDSVLKSYVSKVKKNYDFILIDCLPSLGMLTVNALAASNSVIIPTQPHFFSAKGLEQLLRTVSKVRYEINPKLRIDGIIMTLVMSRTNMNKEVISTIKNSYGHKIKVFDTMIPFSIRAVEATAEGKSIFEYEEKGKVATAYKQFTEELKEELEIVEKHAKNRTDRIR